VGALAQHTARSRSPVLVVSRSLSPEIRKRLRGFGIGCWDLFGGALIELPDIDLNLRREGTGSSPRGGERALRSLAGEMAGRVARALVDLRPPYALGELAEFARVETSCASRVLAFLTEIGLIERPPRGKIAHVNWQEILRLWAQDAPASERGQPSTFLYARGIPDFLTRLAKSGFLHALTGASAFARLAHPNAPLPDTAALYVDDVNAAMAQFDLHPADEGDNVVLIKPADRSAFARSSENAGLRQVSPSLVAADLGEGATFEAAIAWMTKHESVWRPTHVTA
jgi:hypothetical protein